jgi:hypothetical protein
VFVVYKCGDLELSLSLDRPLAFTLALHFLP